MATTGTGQSPPLAKHDSRILDLAFAMDCTGSMGSYIEAARTSVRNIVEAIVAAEKGDVRLALVEYRDHPPQDSTFVTQPHDFTGSVSTMKQWLDVCTADGGGDTPEAVADALHDVLKLSWREGACKICVLIADAPPHGLCQGGDSFPMGCPAGLDPMALVRQMAEKGITLYVVGCEPALCPHKDFFTALAHLTGGQYVPLRSARALAQVIIGGAREEMSLEQLMEEVNEEVMQEARERGEANLDEESLSRRVFGNLRSKGVRTHQLQSRGAGLEAPSASAVEYSAFSNMADLRAAYAPGKTSGSDLPFAFGAPPPPMGAMFRGGSALGGAPLMCGAPLMGGGPPPSASAGFSSAPMAAVPDFEVNEVDLDFCQAQRLVKKSMARNNLNCK